MATPVQRLDLAFAAAGEAGGAGFFRRLRAYEELLRDDPTIRVAIEAITAEVSAAETELDRDDDERIRELTSLRDELVSREPQIDDSGRRRPRGSLIEPGTRNEVFDWEWSLSNFDAVAADTDEKLVQRRGFDASRARTLGEILRAKLHGLQFRPGRVTTSRPDLDDLTRRVDGVLAEHRAQQERVEDLAETSGFLSSRRVALLVSYLRPREIGVSGASEQDDQERAEAILLEVSGDLHHLRDAVRPEESRGPLTQQQQGAITRYEEKGREDLASLHAALRPRIERIEEANAPQGWAALDPSQKASLAVAACGAVAAIATVVAIIIG